MDKLIRTSTKISLPTLYKETASGKLQKWDINFTIYNSKDEQIPFTNSKVKYGKIQTIYGVDKLMSTELLIESGKNKGRSNETSIIEQGISEMVSKWIYQQNRQGYSENLEDTSQVRIKPMLLHKYPESKKYLNINDTWVQEKLDGVRALAITEKNNIKIISRQEEPFPGLLEIKSEIRNLKLPGNIILDGELYSRTLTFNDIISKVKNRKGTTDDSDIIYYVFDLIDLKNPDMGFVDRYKLLASYLNKESLKNIKLVKTYKVNSEEDIEKAFSQLVKKGAEGLVIRAGQGKYQINNRSHYVLKYKPKQDQEFEIIDIVSGRGKEKDQAIFILKTKDGKEFRARPSMPGDIRKQIYKNKEEYIGKQGTVEFFEYTPDGIPRFPVFKSVRID